MTVSTRRGREAHSYRLKRMREQGLKPPLGSHDGPEDTGYTPNAVLDCGWGRLIFGQTFDDPQEIVETMRREAPDRRDIAFYVRDPHVLLAAAPQELFLDPSHTFRLDLSTYRGSTSRKARGFFVRRLSSEEDADEVNRIYSARNMVTVPPEFFWSRRHRRAITYFVAEDETTGEIIGTVTGIDHQRAFNDPELGSSLWCLAVDPQARQPGIGEALTDRLAEHFQARGAAWMDLSVMHDNEQAIALYEKMGFFRVPFFAVKRRNPINEMLYSGPPPEDELNPYARIITDEARRRGISVEVTDAEGGFFRLSSGGRSIHCREALSELTTGVAVQICDDKAVTRRVVQRAGVDVPAQVPGNDTEEVRKFLEEHGAVVVKPARGEQGRGVAVGLRDMESVEAAIAKARDLCDQVIVEQYVTGQDLRLIVIDYRVVAAAIRRPAQVVGDGQTSVRELIARQSRRREAATGGESSIPLDAETERALADAGLDYESVPEANQEVFVRKTANLHTGGTIHDVTDEVHPELIEAAITAARAIDIPVTGIDLLVNSPQEPGYVFVEANERPGLANHEPQPTAERFIDLLFPLSVPEAARVARETGI